MRNRSWVAMTGALALAFSLAGAPAQAGTSGARSRAVAAPVPDVTAFGDAAYFGSTNSYTFNQPIAGLAALPSSRGYWEAAIDGGVYAYGDARFYGSMGGTHLNQPIVGIAATRTGRGYWLVARDGGIFTFGDAHFYGSMGGTHLNQPIVGIAATRTGNGYWLVARDGGIFTFGDAHFYGSTGAMQLNQPIVGMAPTKTGTGYWLAASDGGIFTFGRARFWGSSGGSAHAVVGIAASPAGYGYWLADSDGGVFPFGWIRTIGSAATAAIAKPIVGIAPTPTGKGYWLVGRGTPGVLPGEVTVIAAGPGGGSGEIDLRWHTVPGATGYRVVRATSAAGPFSFAADINVVTGKTSVAPPVIGGPGRSNGDIEQIASDRQAYYPPSSATAPSPIPPLRIGLTEEAFPIHYFRVTAYNQNGSGPPSVIVCGASTYELDC